MRQDKKSTETDAETLVSRLESDGVVTDSREDRLTAGPSPRAGEGPVEPRYYKGELEHLIAWKIEHVVKTGCTQCKAELGELLRDLRSQSEPHLPSEAV